MTRPLDFAAALLTVGLAGSTTVLAQVASPLRGMTVTEYAIEASASLESPSSLAFTSAQNTSPGGMDPSLLGGLATGDGIEGTDWSLAAGGANFNGLAGMLWNVVLVETSMVGGASHATGDTVSGTFTLVFSDSQRLLGRLPNAGVDIDSATLTAEGGSAVDLTAATGTTFAAGVYTLVMAGTVNATYTGGSASVGFSFTNVPGGGGVALLVAMLVVRRRRR